MPASNQDGLKRTASRGPRPVPRRAVLIVIVLVAVIVPMSLWLAGKRPPAPDASFAGPLPPDAVARLGRGSIDVLAVSADGRTLAAGGNVGLFAYDAASLSDRWQYASEAKVHSAAFSPDGRYVAAGLENGTVAVLDAESGELSGVLPVGNDAISQAWGPTAGGGAMVLVVGTNDGHISVTHMQPLDSGLDIELVQVLDYAPGGVTAMAYSADGSLLATANRDGKIDLWNTQTAQKIGEMFNPSASHAILSLAWLTGSEPLLAAGGLDNRVDVWDVDNLSLNFSVDDLPGNVLRLAAALDGEGFSTALADGSAFLYDAQGHLAARIDGLDADAVAAAWLPGGQVVILAGRDGTLQTWDISRAAGAIVPRAEQTQHVHTSAGWRSEALDWSPDGSRIAATSGGRLIVWDTASAAPLLMLEAGGSRVSALAWSPDGSRIASGGGDRAVHIWDARTGEMLLTLTGHRDEVAGLAWSPDGALLASAGALDDMVIIWGLDEEASLHTLPARAQGVWSVAWSPDGTMLAAGTNDGYVLLWDVRAAADPSATIGEADTHLVRQLGWVGGLDWSPDGTEIVAGSSDAVAMLLDVATGDRLVSLVGHEHVLRGAAFSPDGQFVATAAQDGQVIVWDAAGGTAVRAYHGHTAGVDAVAWSPDGTQIASASDDGTVIVWEAP